MPFRGVEDVITLDDFSPGIWGDWQASNGQMPAPDGAAQITDTWGCIASPSGGLMPGPRRVRTVTQALFDVTGSNRYPTNEVRMVVCAMRNLTPVYENSVTPAGQTGYQDEIGVVWSWYYDSGGANNFRHRMRGRIYKHFRAAAGSFDVADFTSAALGNISGANVLHGRADIDITTTQKVAPTLPGTPIMCFLVDSVKDAGAAPLVRYFPDFDTLTTDSQESMSFQFNGSNNTGKLCAHQDRMLACIAHSVQQGSHGFTSYADSIAFTDVNKVSSSTELPFKYVNEIPSGTSCLCSVNASELICVKNDGGGFVIRGSMEDPTIVRIPGIVSTGNADNRGVVCPLGFVYGTRQGVFFWNGGDISENLSPQLDGEFWIQDHTNTIYRDVLDTQNLGSFAFSYPFIAVPNGFLCDIRTRSWWRITDPSTYTYDWWQSGYKGRLIGMPAFVDATQTNAFDWFDLHQGASEYMWRSQPLRRTIQREHQFRDITLVGQGNGHIDVTLIGPGSKEVTRKFHFNDSERPQVLRETVSLRAQDVEVFIHAEAHDTNMPAPRIHRVHLGFHTDHSVPQGTT